MSLILGTIVHENISIENDYLLGILKQIKHYLTLQTSIIVDDSGYCLKISSLREVSSNQTNHINEFYIPKNFIYLFTQWQRIYIENEDDLQFFDICYECLMIIKEYLPTKISIGVQIVEDLINELGTENSPLSLVEFVQNFQAQKNEQFCRRINSNFKTLVTMHQTCINKLEIENILYLSQHFYYYKNKLAAFRFLAHHQNIPNQELASIEDKYIDFLSEISVDEDFRSYSTQILQKIEIAKQIILHKNIKTNEKQNQSIQFSQQNEKHQDQQKQVVYSSKQKIIKQKQKRQKQFRLSSINENSNLQEIFNRQPLKNLQKVNQIKKNTSTIKEDKLRNISAKSLLFQLRETKSLKRLSMLINTASQLEFELKVQEKISKQVQNICKKFLKLNFESNQVKFQNFQQQIVDENILNTKNSQMMKFYSAVEKYFNKKRHLINILQKQRKQKTHKDHSKQKSPKFPNLLEDLRKKIQTTTE